MSNSMVCALSNGYIVDGLETNDPLTNLNSGLSTNLVLGLNSISEVTVNTLSYSVDQGRYGASQTNYITKSGTNQFHGNLYELWNGAALNAADYFTNATPGNHKPGSTVNHFGGSLGGPIIHNKLFFFFDSEWVRIALPIYTTVTVPTPAFQQYVLQQLPLGGTDAITGSHYAPAPQEVPFYQKMFSLYGNTSGTPLTVLGCPFDSNGSPASGSPSNGNGCANRKGVSHSSDDHEQVQTARVDYNIGPNDTTWYRFQADTGLQAAYTDPINPIFNAFSPQPLYSFAAGYTHVFSQNLVNYFNPAFSWYESLFAPSDFPATLADIAVYHPKVVDKYRSAHKIALRLRSDEATTEEMRTALIHFRSLFDEVVHTRMSHDAYIRALGMLISAAIPAKLTVEGRPKALDRVDTVRLARTDNRIVFPMRTTETGSSS
jgi:hypothetical protein